MGYGKCRCVCMQYIYIYVRIVYCNLKCISAMCLDHHSGLWSYLCDFWVPNLVSNRYQSRSTMQNLLQDFIAMGI